MKHIQFEYRGEYKDEMIEWKCVFNITITFCYNVLIYVLYYT
jgi:hypothetical protein